MFLGHSNRKRLDDLGVNPIKLLGDLIAGALGLSYGPHIAWFKAIVANKLDPVYAETYQYNHPYTKMN